MVLPETKKLGPAYARAYYLDNDNKMRCLLPCSNKPFCPFHGAVPKEGGAPSVPDPDEEAADPSAAPKAEKEAAAPKPSASASPSPSGPPPSSSCVREDQQA